LAVFWGTLLEVLPPSFHQLLITVRGSQNWMLLWSLLWPNWAFGMIWTVYVEEEQVCDNVCWDLCVTMGWRGICCCCLLFPLQVGPKILKP
jgi:hypothetical protein